MRGQETLSIDNHGRNPLRRGRSSAVLAILLLIAGGLAACGGGDPEAATVENGRLLSADAIPARPTVINTVADIFPDTGRRGLVLNNCSTCHAVACVTQGQRDRARWKEVEVSHEYNIPGLSKEDHGKIFDYLLMNFNETQPEPVVPPEYFEGGCPELFPQAPN